MDHFFQDREVNREVVSIFWMGQFVCNRVDIRFFRFVH